MPAQTRSKTAQETATVDFVKELSIISATTKKKRAAGRVNKDVSNKPTGRKRVLKVKLNIRYSKWSYEKLKLLGIRLKPNKKDYWPYPDHKGVKLGHDPYSLLSFKAPTESKIREVHKLLVEYHQTFEIGSYTSMPAHGSVHSTTVDVIIQTILAQSTGNENAIDQHSRLCNAFPFLVDGKKHVGKMPDWHTIRTLPREELERCLKQGGFQIMRAKFIQGVLNFVYEKNIFRKVVGLQAYKHDGNPPDAKDFVPGMLSMDYLTDSGADNSTEAILGRLLQLPGIGLKSAMCVLAFSLKRPLFVVDTHLLRVCKWLGWIPKDATENAAAMYLHNYIPDDIKYDLHNQIWTHCANENNRESQSRAVICPFCGANPPAKNRDVSQYVCPLAKFLPSLDERWKKEYTTTPPAQTTASETEPAVEVSQTPEEAMKTQDIDDYEIQDNVLLPAMQNAMQDTNDQTISLAPPTPESFQEHVNDEVDSVAATPTKKKTTARKVKKLNLTKLKSIRHEDVPATMYKELEDAGFRLWEFRPMDNTFMEEWGTFDKSPRFKWERADVMDEDVAVTTEYANSVLYDGARHKWSMAEETQVVEDQILSTMEE